MGATETPAYLTTDETSRRLGVSRERVSFWVQSGKMPIAARSNVGFLLDARIVDRIGPALAAGAPAFPWSKGRGRRKAGGEHRLDRPPEPLACGCVPGRSFCRHGAILSAAVQLAEGFAAECDTPTYRGLARLARAAFDEHLKPPASDPENSGDTPTVPAECVA